MVDLEKSAVKPFVSHRSRVKALATINSFCIISGGEGASGKPRGRETQPGGLGFGVSLEGFWVPGSWGAGLQWVERA